MNLVFEELPYSFDAFKPCIDARTMEIHYIKHHRAMRTLQSPSVLEYCEQESRRRNV